MAQSFFSGREQASRSEKMQAAMEEGVQFSDKILVIASPDYFTRPFCIKELEWVAKYKIPMVVAIDMQYKHDIGSILQTCPPHLRNIGQINWIDLNRGDKDYWEVGMKKIFSQPAEVLEVLVPQRSQAQQNSSYEARLKEENERIKREKETARLDCTFLLLINYSITVIISFMLICSYCTCLSSSSIFF